MAGVGIWLYLVPQLPETESLSEVQFQVPLRVYSAEGELIAEFGEKRRVPLTVDQMPKSVLNAVIATEDEHFYTHPGVDWRGLVRAVWYLVRTGEKGPGGSTITMQLARNFFLGREKTYYRKLNEILLALKIERELSKDKILELYLNKIFLGHRSYGIGAAALVYYGKTLDELSLAQQAMIAGLPQRPSAYNPIVNPDRATKRRNYVLGRMLTVGFIDRAEHDDAISQPITASLYKPKVELEAPYIAEMVRAYMERRVGENVYTEGYHVYTTIRGAAQRAANAATRGALLAYDERHGYRGPEMQLDMNDDASPAQRRKLVADLPVVGGLNAALVLQVFDKEIRVDIPAVGEATITWDGLKWARKFVTEDRLGKAPKNAIDVVAPGDVVRVRQVDDAWLLSQVPKVEGALVSLRPDDGALIALTGGFDFYRSKFNRAVQAERQPGSNFKPFVYSAGLEAGLTAATTINDAPVVFDDPALETAWRPENYSGKFFGPTRIRQALTKSRNLVSIRILREIGIDYTLNHVARFGLDETRLPRDLSLALGSGSLTPLEVATGYAVFGNGGFAVEPYFIDRIEDRDRVLVARASPTVVCRECEEVTPTESFALRGIEDTNLEDISDPKANPSARVAPRVVPGENIWIMNSILRDVIRFGTGRKALALKRRDIAGKTGTTNDQRDAWFSGFTSRVATTAWVGFDKLDPLGRRETGGRAALPMWVDYMRTALDGTPDEIRSRPRNVVSRRVSRSTGQVADVGEDDTMVEFFRAGRTARRVASSANGRTEIQGASADAPTPKRRQTKRSRAAQGATEKLF